MTMIRATITVTKTLDVPDPVLLWLLMNYIGSNYSEEGTHSRPFVNKIAAIKYIREQVGCNLKEAKDYMDDFDLAVKEFAIAKSWVAPSTTPTT